MDAEEAHAIGWALWRVRDRRRLSLRVVAGLAGMSKDTLNRIERGERSPTLKEIYALAEALRISAAELTRLPVPAPANGHTDSTAKAIGIALDAIEVGRPGGMVLPLEVLRDQVAEIHRQRRACQFAEMATELPGLIRNLHTTLATGRDHAALLDLAVYLHTHVTRLWLAHAHAENHLVRRVAFLALRLAEERDEITTLAVAQFGVADTLWRYGSAALAQAELETITFPPTTADTAGLIGVLISSQALIAALTSRPEDVGAPMDAASELAGQFGNTTGETDSLGFLYGPVDTRIDRMWLALEANEPDRTVRIAQGIDPNRHPFRVNQTFFWTFYGRALTQLPKRREDAVMALRTAERIFPTKVLRDPMVRNALAELLTRPPGGVVGQELRGMARRAGLLA